MKIGDLLYHPESGTFGMLTAKETAWDYRVHWFYNDPDYEWKHNNPTYAPGSVLHWWKEAEKLKE